MCTPTVLRSECIPSTTGSCAFRSRTRPPGKQGTAAVIPWQGSGSPRMIESAITMVEASDGGGVGAAEGWRTGDESGLSTVKRFSSLSSRRDGRGRRISFCFPRLPLSLTCCHGCFLGILGQRFHTLILNRKSCCKEGR